METYYRGSRTILPLEGGWIVVRSVHNNQDYHYLNHTHDGETYFVNHTYDKAYHVEQTSMVCTNCGVKAPEAVIGFLNLCNWNVQ